MRSMPIDLETWKALYAKGAAAAGEKLETKFEANADLAVQKLKDPKTADTWQKRVSSSEAKANFRGKTKNLQTSDLVTPMKEKGVQNYLTSVSAPSTIEKAAKGVAPFVPLWEKSKKDKKAVVTEQDAIDNMVMNMKLFKAKKQELNK